MEVTGKTFLHSRIVHHNQLTNRACHYTTVASYTVAVKNDNSHRDLNRSLGL